MKLWSVGIAVALTTVLGCHRSPDGTASQAKTKPVVFRVGEQSQDTPAQSESFSSSSASSFSVQPTHLPMPGLDDGPILSGLPKTGDFPEPPRPPKPVLLPMPMAAASFAGASSADSPQLPPIAQPQPVSEPVQAGQ